MRTRIAIFLGAVCLTMLFAIVMGADPITAVSGCHGHGTHCAG